MWSHTAKSHVKPFYLYRIFTFVIAKNRKYQSHEPRSTESDANIETINQDMKLNKLFLLFHHRKLEQLERLRSENTPAAPWLPVLSIHIRSQVKKYGKNVSRIVDFC